MQTLTWNDYVPLANRTAKQLPYRQQQAHSRMGIITEVGELVDLYKRHLIYGKDFDVVNFREEVGDICWYIALDCQTEGHQLRLQGQSVNPEGPTGNELDICFALTRIAASLTDTVTTAMTLELICYRLQELCAIRGVNFFECLAVNIAKLAERYGDKYSDQAALVRDLISERKVLSA